MTRVVLARICWLVCLSALPSLPSASVETEQGSSPQSLTSLLMDFRSLAPAREGFRVHDRSARVGHLELQFEEGLAFPLRSESGVTLGLLFEGKGRFAYRSEDAGDLETLHKKTAKLNPVPVITPTSIGDSFGTFLVVFANPEPEFLLSPEVTMQPVEPSPLDARTQADFLRIWKQMDSRNLGFDHLGAEVRLAQGSGQYLSAQIETRSGSLNYLFDSARELLEILYLALGDATAGQPTWNVLSVQAVNGGPWVPHGAMYLRYLSLDIDARDPKKGSVKSRLGLEVARDGTGVGGFYLRNQRSLDHSDWKYAAHPWRVLRVTDSSGKSLPFSHRYHELLVTLPRVLNKGETLELTFDAEGDLSDPRETERGPSVALWGGPWFPIPFGRSPDGFTFTLQMKTRRPDLPIASGKQVSLAQDSDGYTLTTRATLPIRSLVAVAGPFSASQAEVEGQRVRFYTPANASTKDLTSLLRQAFVTLRNLLGPPPEQDLQIVQIPLAVQGTAVPGMIFLSDEAIPASPDSADSEFSLNQFRTILDLLSREWLGLRTQPKTNEDVWLLEGISGYLADLATSLILVPHKREWAVSRLSTEHWQNVRRYCAEGAPLRMAGVLRRPDEPALGHCLRSDRSPLTIQMLLLSTGDEPFFRTLLEVFGPGGPDSISSDEYRRRLEQASHLDLGWFFQDWVQRDGIPGIDVKLWVLEKGSGISVSGEAKQRGGEDFRRTVIPIVLEYEGGNKDLRVVLQDKPVTTFKFAVSSRPKKISVDPAHCTLAEFHQR